MSTRFQAQLNQPTQNRLNAIREALSLESSEKAALLDEISQIAYWVIQQACSGRQIQAVDEHQGAVQTLEHASLAALRRPVRIELTAQEAAALVSLLERSEAPNPALQKTLALIQQLDEAPHVTWQEEQPK